MENRTVKRIYLWPNLLSYTLFLLGLALIFYGFHEMLHTLHGMLFSILSGVGACVLGYFSIFLSAQTARLPHSSRRPCRRAISLSLPACGIWAFFFIIPSVAEAQDFAQWRIESVEIGRQLAMDSDRIIRKTSFTKIQLQLGPLQEAALWIRRLHLKDTSGTIGSQEITLNARSGDWLAFKVGYERFPVWQVRIAWEAKGLRMALGHRREAVKQRLVSLLDSIYLDQWTGGLSLSLIRDHLWLNLEGAAGRYRDHNRLTAHSFSLRGETRISFLKLLPGVGYYTRLLDRYSPYYWSPKVYRELFVYADIAREAENYWIWLSLSVTRVLQEQYDSPADHYRMTGLAGELSMGYRVGPGHLYLTARLWDSGAFRRAEFYRGQVLEISYELDRWGF